MDRISWRGVLTRLGLAAAISVGAATASAGPIISVDITGGEGGIYDTYVLEAEGTENPDGTFSLSGIGYGTTFQCDWALVVNPDPSITGTFNLTNLSATTQNFVLNVSLPIPGGLAAPTVMGGYIGDATNGVEYFDQNLDSDVTLASVGSTPIYQARLDNLTTVQGLLLGTFNAFGGPGISGNISQLLWGTPIPSAPGPAVAGSMQTRVTFSLSAGDRVALPVNFVVEPSPVPEPASIVLIGLGVAALVGLRSRRA
ncbi:MAG: PEP-CTERM sorting domain-containing protein [Myxococcota bacterium]